MTQLDSQMTQENSIMAPTVLRVLGFSPKTYWNPKLQHDSIRNWDPKESGYFFRAEVL